MLFSAHTSAFKNQEAPSILSNDTISGSISISHKIPLLLVTWKLCRGAMPGSERLKPAWWLTRHRSFYCLSRSCFIFGGVHFQLYRTDWEWRHRKKAGKISGHGTLQCRRAVAIQLTPGFDAPLCHKVSTAPSPWPTGLTAMSEGFSKRNTRASPRQIQGLELAELTHLPGC